MSEEVIEKKIKDKGLTAPRLTSEDIDAKIKGTTFTKLPSGKCMICELTLKNGFTVRGKASCVSPENFDQEIGEMISLAAAREKIWQLEGYLLQEKNPVGQTAKDRAEIELKELEDKCDKLHCFLEGNKCQELNEKVQNLLHDQMSFMLSYLNALEHRLPLM